MELYGWMFGLYNKSAIVSSLDNKAKYPKNPIEERSNTVQEIAKKNGMTQEEIQQNLKYISMRVKEVNTRLEKRGR